MIAWTLWIYMRFLIFYSNVSAHRERQQRLGVVRIRSERVSNNGRRSCVLLCMLFAPRVADQVKKTTVNALNQSHATQRIKTSQIPTPCSCQSDRQTNVLHLLQISQVWEMPPLPSPQLGQTGEILADSWLRCYPFPAKLQGFQLQGPCAALLPVPADLSISFEGNCTNTSTNRDSKSNETYDIALSRFASRLFASASIHLFSLSLMPIRLQQSLKKVLNAKKSTTKHLHCACKLASQDPSFETSSSSSSSPSTFS